MPPTKKEKTKTDLDEAVFRFNDKKDELEEVLDDENITIASLVNTTMHELSDKWEIVVSSYMNFIKIRDEEDDRPVVEECSTKYKTWRKSFVAVKNRVSTAVDQQISNTRQQNVEVVDKADQVDSVLQAVTFARQRIEDEVCLAEENIAELSSKLSRDTVSNHRVQPDQLSSSIENRLAPLLQRQVELEPQKREEFQSSHRAFLRTQLSKLNATRTLLFGKQANLEPRASSASSLSNPNVRGPPRLQLEKLKVPTFDGDHTKWLLFKSKFKDIVVAGAGYDDTAQGHILRDVVPKEAQERIEHVKLASEMLEILDKIYGDPATSVSIIVNKLLNLELKSSADYDQVLELCDVINRYCVVLASLSSDAANHVKYNTNLLSHLVSLLPGTYGDKWYDYIITQSSVSRKWDVFTDWLGKMEKRANAQKLDNLATMDKKASPCSKFKTTTHSTAQHPKTPLNTHATGVQPTATVCPECKVFHERNGVKGNIIIDCTKWRELQTVNERAKLVEKMAGCKRCLRWDHKAGSDCSSVKGFSIVREKLAKFGSFVCGKTLTNGQRCTADHSPYLCGTNVEYCCLTRLTLYPNTAMPDPTNDPIVLLPIQEIKLQNQSVHLFWDDGSTATLCTYRLASRLGLIGSPVSYSMQTVDSGGWVMKQGQVYEIKLNTNSGEVYTIAAYGVESIADCSQEIMVDQSLKKLVPDVPSSVWSRHKGEVDLLIGSNLTHLMPKDCYEVDNLRVKSSKFGSGYCLQGTSRAISLGAGGQGGFEANSLQVEEAVYAPGVRGARIQTMKVQIQARDDILPSPMQCEHNLTTCYHNTMDIPFLESELEGVAPPRRCRRCKQCPECSDRNQMLTELEIAQLGVIESKVRLDLNDNRIKVEYPFTTDPAVLGDTKTNNRGQAIAVQRSVENRLIKKGLVDVYNSEMNKFIKRGTVSLVTQEELAGWEGAVHYVSHHEVLKPSSGSTPCRIVTNSALVNKTCGKSLNQILMKGPNCLNSLVEVLIRFRSYEIALIFDLSKAYNSLLTGPVEKFTRLIVWRDCDRTADWKTYGYECVAFGDLSASCQLECGKGYCADAGADIDPEASVKIKKDLYVDDAATGGTKEQVARFRGKRREDGSYDGTFSQILGLGNLDIKAMLVSGEYDREALEKLGDQVLGIKYEVVEDKFFFLLEMHISPKKRGVRTEEPVTLDSLSDLSAINLTPRIQVGLVNSFYDPLGLMCPWLIKFKLLLKKTTEPEYKHLTWDDKIPDQLAALWKSLISETLQLGTIHFPRSFRPEGAVGPPSLAGFWDGSLLAWACAVYCRYTLSTGEVVVRLVAAKARVSPSKGTSVPKVEVSGLLDLSRLLNVVVKGCSEPPESITLMGDSECSISMYEKSGSSLAPFFCNRIGEIRSNLELLSEHCRVEPLQHISGDLNPADLPTRGHALPEDLAEDSVWQRGPNFLYSLRGEWPVSRDFIRKVPEEANRMKVAQFSTTVLQNGPLTGKRIILIILSLSYSDCLTAVTAIIARLIIGWSEGISKSKRDVGVEDLKKAKNIMMFLSQKQVRSKLQDKKLDSLNPIETNQGIIVTKGRLGEGMKAVLGQSSLAILTPTTRLAKLIMWSAHREMHRATPAETAARSRKYAWILQAKQLAISVCKKCMLCRQIHLHLGKQIMGDRKAEHLLQAPPFTFTACDLLGPFKCKGMVNARSAMKVWGVIYICQGTGAVRSYLCPGYDTKAFITAHDKFLAHCGNPQTITSDRGSQIKKAAKVLEYTEAQDPSKWNWDLVKNAGAKLGTDWIFIPPGTQWRNRAEAAVKVMKKTLDSTINSQEKLNFSELETVLISAANVMNDRPLTVRVYDEHTYHPITVNQLLLGRTTTNIASIDYQSAGSALERLEYREEVETAWWSQFSAQVLPTLVPFTRWKEEYPNREVGDIVFVHYPGLKKAEYRMGKVSQVMPDKNGRVRTVEVLMRPKDKRTDGSVRYTHKDLEPMTVPVQRTALLMPSTEVTANTFVHTPNFTSLSATMVTLDTTDHGAPITLYSGCVIPASVMAYTPAMQLKEYREYENYRKTDGDMKCESSIRQVNVWKID